LEVAREAHDAQVMANLRAELDELMKRPGPRILTRENVLALLRLLLAGLSPATDVPLGTVSTGQMLVTLHPSMALLARISHHGQYGTCQRGDYGRFGGRAQEGVTLLAR
jgi:hypothetical protein